MNKEDLKRAILKEISGVQKSSSSNTSYEITLVPKEELEKSTPKKSRENSATTPRTAAAIKQIQEIAKMQQATEPPASVTLLKVDADKVTDDVEMLSAKTSALRIGSPPKSIAPNAPHVFSSIPLTVTSVTTVLTPRSTDVDMPSARREEPALKEVKEGENTTQEPPKVLDAKALIKAAILNGRKPRSGQ